MPRYYMDVRLGDRHTADQDGTEFDGVELACDGAVDALAEIVKEALRGTRQQTISIEISDGTRKPLRRLVLTFVVEELD